MSKLHNLKNWFSLPDAAERLSAGLEESVEVSDILQLVIEGHLPLSWYLRYVPARRVAPFTALYGRGFGKSLFEELGLVAEKTADDTLKMITGWEPLDGEDAVVRLEGPFRLELQYCGALMDRIHSHLTDTGGELLSLDGFFVSDAEKTIWQIMEYHPGGRDKVSTGESKSKSFYYPSEVFPKLTELIIQRHDVEAFEHSLVDPLEADSPTLSQRAETSYLNMIGTLLEVATKGIPDPEHPGSKIGPATRFTSEAKLIVAIAEYYRDIQGLSKRNLEAKFPAAKRSLDNCS